MRRNGNPADDFITGLFNLVEQGRCGDLHDELIGERIVVRPTDKNLSERSLLEAYLILEKAMTQARQKELLHQHQGILRQKLDSIG